MSEWIAVNSRDSLPKEVNFLCMWKGCVAMAEYDEDIDKFIIVLACGYGLNSFDLIEERERKITHWMPLPEPPKEPL